MASGQESSPHVSSISSQMMAVNFEDDTDDLRFHANIITEPREVAILVADTMSNPWSPGNSLEFILFVDAATNVKIKAQGEVAESTNGAGAAVVYQTPGGEWMETTFRLSSRLTSQRAEMIAISKGLTIAVSEILSRNGSKVVILTDCESAMFKIDRFRHSSASERQRNDPILRRLVEKLQFLNGLEVEIEIRWVPGHSGVEGNQRAHIAARSAARQAPNLPAPRVPPRPTGRRTGMAEIVYSDEVLRTTSLWILDLRRQLHGQD